jgi:t-SNARE complex subunit (syntaxin)
MVRGPACSAHVHRHNMGWLCHRPMQVGRAVEHVQRGTQQLEEAKKLGQNTRKWLCCTLIVLLSIAAIVVVVVFVLGN